MRRFFCALSGSVLLLTIAGGAWAASGGDEHKLTTHQIFRSSSLPRNFLDFSMYHFVPRGDKVIEEPEHSRLLFRKKDGRPDGFAERRGGAIVYYDRRGKAVRVQRLTEDELARLNQN